MSANRKVPEFFNFSVDTNNWFLDTTDPQDLIASAENINPLSFELDEIQPLPQDNECGDITSSAEEWDQHLGQGTTHGGENAAQAPQSLRDNDLNPIQSNEPQVDVEDLMSMLNSPLPLDFSNDPNPTDANPTGAQPVYGVKHNQAAALQCPSPIENSAERTRNVIETDAETSLDAGEDELSFANESQAEEAKYAKATGWDPSSTLFDETWPTSDATKQSYVKKIMAAFKDTESMSSESARTLNTLQNALKYDPDTVEIAAWDVLRLSLKFYQNHGRQYRKVIRSVGRIDESAAEIYQEYIPFSQHISRLLRLFKAKKSQVVHLLNDNRGDAIMGTIMDPELRETKVAANAISNRRREMKTKMAQKKILTLEAQISGASPIKSALDEPLFPPGPARRMPPRAAGPAQRDSPQHIQGRRAQEQQEQTQRPQMTAPAPRVVVPAPQGRKRPLSDVDADLVLEESSQNKRQKSGQPNVSFSSNALRPQPVAQPTVQGMQNEGHGGGIPPRQAQRNMIGRGPAKIPVHHNNHVTSGTTPSQHQPYAQQSRQYGFDASVLPNGLGGVRSQEDRRPRNTLVPLATRSMEPSETNAPSSTQQGNPGADMNSTYRSPSVNSGLVQAEAKWHRFLLQHPELAGGENGTLR